MTDTLRKLLLVDDDRELSSMLKEFLQREGFSVDTAYDGEEGVQRVAAQDYDLVILDVMMPGVNGIEALGRIRLQSQIPVLMLTARGDDVDRIIGLELGADDYVPKPCLPRELVARIRAILRRSRNEASADVCRPVQVGELKLWPERRQAQWRGQPLELTSTEFSLLEVLAQHAGKVVSKDELSMLARGRALTRYDRSIDVHMSSIRQKLGQLDCGRSCIQTVRGLGYQLIWE